MKQKIYKHTKPLVSVIIPIFNGASFIEEAVNSVQKSIFRRFEVLLIDDGSTDESKELCKQLSKKYRNVKFYSFEKNKGLGRTLNFALEKARGTYICRLNQDDRMLPHRIAVQVEFLQKHPEIVAVGSYIKYFDSRNRTEILKFRLNDEDIRRVWHIVSPFSDPSVMYCREIALKVGGYYQSMWPADDTHLWIRMGTKGKLANISQPLVEVRWHDKAASVQYFTTLALSTYRMHLWVNDHIEKAPMLTHLFWLIQLVSGLLLPPHFNWGAYRVLKKMISAYDSVREFFRLMKTKLKRLVNAISIPKKFNISGVYSK